MSKTKGRSGPDGTLVAILSFYPRERAIELTKAYFDALPPDDTVLLPETSAEELEREMERDFGGMENMPPEAQAELEGLKQLLRDVRGKKVSELPTTPEQDAAFIAEEAETALTQIFSGWMQALYLWEKQEGSGARLTDTLEPAAPVRELGGKDWKEVNAEATPFTAEQIRELHEAFAANLRAKIDATPDCRVATDWTIKKDAQGYHLAP